MSCVTDRSELGESLTQVEVAEALGTSRANINGIERRAIRWLWRQQVAKDGAAERRRVRQRSWKKRGGGGVAVGDV